MIENRVYFIGVIFMGGVFGDLGVVGEYVLYDFFFLLGFLIWVGVEAFVSRKV